MPTVINTTGLAVWIIAITLVLIWLTGVNLLDVN